MNEQVLDKYGIKQIGYYVKSIEETAEFLRSSLGAGPFVDLGANPLESCKVRGEDVELKMRTALGHINDIQLELIEVESAGPDPYHEMGHFGLHHFCIWVDDVDVAVEAFEESGMPLAMRITSGQGLQVAYVDAREQLGQYIEVNTPAEQLWQGIKAVHENSPAEAPALMPMTVLMQGK